MQTYGEIATTIMFTFPLNYFIVPQTKYNWYENAIIGIFGVHVKTLKWFKILSSETLETFLYFILPI